MDNIKKIDKIKKYEIIDIIRLAIQEDLGGYGDITSKYLIGDNSISKAYIICKEEEAVLSGIDIIKYILEEFSSNLSCNFNSNFKSNFCVNSNNTINNIKNTNKQEYNKNITFNILKEDGDFLKNKDIICYIFGPTKVLLAAERTCLNFLQHLSGIATITAKFNKITSKYGVKIVDTRKTKPGLRRLEKYAVKCGGGHNHRFGLFDGILIKDNHIISAGGIKKAINLIRNNIPHQLKIEVEVKNLEELKEAIESKPDIIMLDNMDFKLMSKAVKIIRSNLANCIIEASGNVKLETVEDICKTGVDIISCGFITHSAKAIDFSMEFE